MLLAAAAILAAVGLHRRLPSLPQILAVLRGADLSWVVLAATLQAVSMTMFALQQRALLAALGVRVGHRRAVAVTLARSAISISVPAGAAVSAGYAIRQYRQAGSSHEIAAATMVVSGLVSIGGLATLYLAGSADLIAGNPAMVWTWPLSAVLGTAAAAMLTGMVLRRWPGRRSATSAAGARRAPAGRVGRYLERMVSVARDAWRAGAALRSRDWLAALAFAAANWLTDLLCLAAATHAVGLPIGTTALAGIYLGVQIVRQIPITPGGVGLIETALVTGLTAAGTSAASAAAAVLIYRLLSCWLLIPAGGLAALVLRRAPVRTAPTGMFSGSTGSPTVSSPIPARPRPDGLIRSSPCGGTEPTTRPTAPP